jgi:predicted Zn-dependent peptidase
MNHVHGITTGIFVSTGSRYETNRIAGISHFIEHIVFKGTEKRPSSADISAAIEGVGGYLNAATSQDYTFFYNRVPHKHSAVALDVLSDMLSNALLDEEAIRREKGVILEELNMYLDTPVRHIYDLVMTAAWPNSTLGRDIIGTPASIKSVQKKDFLSYMAKTYSPENMVVCAAGNLSHAKIVKLVKKYFDQNKNSKKATFKKVTTVQKSPQVLIHPKPTDQVHLALAVPSLPRGHKQENVLSLIDTILGTGMNSRLFLNIREKRGLCYSISSFTERFADTGLFGITAGLNTSKIELALKAITAELESLSKLEVSDKELNEAKEYLRGSLNLQLDSTDNMAIWYGSQALFYKNIKTPEQRINSLLKVTKNDIIKLSKSLFQRNKLNLAIIGPFKESQKNRFLKLLN